MSQQLPPQYNPKEIETKWFDAWAKTPLFHARVACGKKPFTVLMPPPNVTGVLHMGHALNNTIQDILIRTRRMQGLEALWMPGTDHAGIATQNVVERSIAKDGLKRQDLGRDEFLKRVWHWKEEHGSTIIHQLKRMGATCDWQRERFTMDEGYSRAVIDVFVRLYEKGLIYRGDYIINWCPRCQTALSDEEAPHRELDGKLYYIKYPLKKVIAAEGRGTKDEERNKKKSVDRGPSAMDHIVVATTRPETMLGDTAVAVNPKDKRYKSLIGATIILPLMDREIKIIADPRVDKTFGTGAVKVTPAHDPNDYQMGKSHDLEFINIMNPDGVLNRSAGDYAGLDRFEAREAICEDLKERKILLKVEAHKHAVGHCYRCSTIIEPYLSKQWFVRMKPLSRPAIKAVKTGNIKFHPKRWTKVYCNWMAHIKDWCISRQIWWGHRLPVFYCKNCLGQTDNKSKISNPKSKTNFKSQIPNFQERGVIVSRTKPEKCPHCGNSDLEQDSDVLDTWFSSWLWPFATFGWPGDKDDGRGTMDEGRKEREYFYPTSVLVTAPEIIFFWVARMIMAGCEFMGNIPFRDVHIHGTVRDAEGRKMSKSLGNSIDPLEIIDRYGADALRFSLIAVGSSGSDIFLSQERFEQGRNFANKIWNASRFILMNMKDGVTGENIDVENLNVQDLWILNALNETVKKVSQSIDAYKFNEALNSIYEFFWHKFCDWYVEAAKHTLEDQNTQEVLLRVLKQSLLLLSPFMPFIADEVSARLPGEKKETIAVASWPQVQKKFENKAVCHDMEFVFACVLALRNLRIELNLLPQVPLCVRLSISEKQQKRAENAVSLIKNLAHVSRFEITTSPEVAPNSLSALIEKDIHLYLLLEGLVDSEKEKDRIDQQIEDFKKQLASKEKMLKNKDFIKKAPRAVVEKERKRVKECKDGIARLRKVRNAFR